MEIMEEKNLEEELPPMFRALNGFTETNQTLNENFLTRIFCATGICLGCRHSLMQPF